jgi:RNA polymerase sigma-70 factor (ECF subfamily)
MPTIETYISSFQKGQFEHFDDFYHLTYKQVFFTLKKYIKDSMLVDDLMQEVYMKFLNKIKDIDVSKQVMSYLTTMARNLAIDHLRKTQHVTFDEITVYHALDEHQVDQDYLWLLNHLNDLDKDLVYMHVIESMTFKNIAIILDMPLGTVLWRYQKAMKKMKEVLKHESKKTT